MEWFVDEQIEEETMFAKIIKSVERFLKMDDEPGLDDFLEKRVI